jgi:hypothetical protein
MNTTINSWCEDQESDFAREAGGTPRSIHIPDAYQTSSYPSWNAFPQSQATTPDSSSSNYSMKMDHEPTSMINVPPIIFNSTIADNQAISSGGEASIPTLSHAIEIQRYNPSARDLIHFGIQSNLELDSLDFGLLDSYNEMLLSALGKSVPGRISHFQSEFHSQQNEQQLAHGIEAFRRSLWRWTPVQQDHIGIEQQNLVLPSETGTLLKLQWRSVKACVDQSTRDKILATVLTAPEFGNPIQTASSFPSTDLLDTFINLVFTKQRQGLEVWIHPATFEPSSARPNLLTALVAAGAVLTPVPTVRKLGYALQEVSRYAIVSSFEKDNVMTRDLQTLQAYVVQLKVALHSGNKRKMEIAEALFQPLVTMMRRAGRYRRSEYKNIFPLREDSGKVLEQKWRDWAEQQQFVRLVYHVFLHDAQASMSLLINPIISYAELSLPLPESRELFFAESAEEWKSIYLSILESSLSAENVPSFTDNVRSFPYSVVSPTCTRVDYSLTTLATLHAFWGQIWEYRQLSSIANHSPTSPITESSSNYLTNRYNLLYQNLMQASNTLTSLTPSTSISSECSLLIELLAMSLHVSLDDVQSYAGKNDEEESRRIFPLLEQWMNGSDSRHAIWHAGRLLREAKSIPRRGGLYGFWAIAVYHAALTLWAYGVLFRLVAHQKEDGDVIWLDAPLEMTDDHENCRQWVAGGPGRPRIGWAGPGAGNPPGASVIDPKAVMDDIGAVFRWGAVSGSDEPLQPLVENLVELMDELGKAATLGAASDSGVNSIPASAIPAVPEAAMLGAGGDRGVNSIPAPPAPESATSTARWYH